MEVNREEIFDKINEFHRELSKLETLVRISRGANTEFEKGLNSMYHSPETGGGIFDNAVSVHTSTKKDDDGDQTDFVSMCVSGANIDEEDMILLSKDECIDLIRYLATAVSLLRN